MYIHLNVCKRQMLNFNYYIAILPHRLIDWLGFMVYQPLNVI